MKTVIKNCTVIDGTGAGPRPSAAVLISGSEVEAVADMGDSSIDRFSTDASVIDGSGLWVIPGLINMHEHLMLREVVGDPVAAMKKTPVESTIIAMSNAREGLARGWTTVRDMASAHGIAQTLREAILRGEIKGPRVIAAGTPVSVTGGHGYAICREADGVDDCRRAAREQLKAGADFLKVMASHDPYPMSGFEQTRAEMTLQEISAVFDEARRWGKPTACHAMGTTALRNVLDAGVDVVDHGVYLDVPLAARMAQSGTYLCPTLSAYDRQTMNPKFQRGEAWARAHAVLVKPHEESIVAAVREGVRIVVGTDTTGSYSEEVELLQAAGMSPMDSLLACTATAADALGLAEQLGRIKRGFTADLVAVRANPLDSPAALDDIAYVVQDGISYRPEALRA